MAEAEIKLNILEPRATEKTYREQTKRTYVFAVKLTMGKQEIAKLVEKEFNVKVTDVRTLVLVLLIAKIRNLLTLLWQKAIQLRYLKSQKKKIRKPAQRKPKKQKKKLRRRTRMQVRRINNGN